MAAALHALHLPHHRRHGFVHAESARRAARDVLVAVEVGVAALVLGTGVDVVSGRLSDPGPAAEPPSITQVVEVPAGMLSEVDIVTGSGTGTDGAGTVVGGGVLVERPLRVEGLPAGTYHLVVRSASGVEQVGDVAISASSAVRLAPFEVPDGGTVVVSPATVGR
jgi:hypothetical protein